MSGSGEMNRRATFQRSTVTANTFNELIDTWVTLASVWINRHDVSAAESFRAQEVGAELTTRFRIRYSNAISDLNPRDRVVYRGLTYQITGVRESKRNRWIEVDCVARSDIAAAEVSP